MTIISIIYGTRPEFLKLKTVIIDKKKNFKFNVIRINQHTDIEDSDILDSYNFKELSIDENNKNRLSNIGSNILQKLPDLIKDSTHILIQGDTASCFYSALCAYQMGKKIIHLEAGMRTYDLYNPYPEEGYRQMISRITDIHLCPSFIEKNNLIKENIIENIYVVGNTILDLVKTYKIETTRENKVLITLHRRENWNIFKDYLIELIKLAINNPILTFYFILHPNPSFKKIWDDILYIDNINIPNNITVNPPITHKELIELLSLCNYVITDSGGIQEEANFLGKYIYVLRKQTERNAIKNMTICDLNNVLEIKDIEKDCEYGYEYGKGDSTHKIIEIFNNLPK
jgi:UDP-N-acetylglucosamine 2-epimerase (non-hydrolysing)